MYKNTILRTFVSIPPNKITKKNKPKPKPINCNMPGLLYNPSPLEETC